MTSIGWKLDASPEEWMLASPFFQKTARRPYLAPPPSFGSTLRKTDATIGFRLSATRCSDQNFQGTEATDSPSPTMSTPDDKPPKTPLFTYGLSRERPKSKSGLRRSLSTPGTVRLDPLPEAQADAARRLTAHGGSWDAKHSKASSKRKDSRGTSKQQRTRQPASQQGCRSLCHEDAESSSNQEALQSIQEVARNVSEVLTHVSTQIGQLGEEQSDYTDHLGALREISSASSRVRDHLERPSKVCIEEGYSYDDPFLARARKLAELSQFLVEDIELAASGIGAPDEEDHAEEEFLNDINSASKKVMLEMQRLQNESWAASALSVVADASDGLPVVEPTQGDLPGAKLTALTDECQLCEDASVQPIIEKLPDQAVPLRASSKDSSASKMTQPQPATDDFTPEDMKDLRSSFRRFKVQDSSDMNKEAIPMFLEFSGRWQPEQDKLDTLLKEVTMYDYLNFSEFLQFMKSYYACEREEQQRVFKEFDQDGSGSISVSELRSLLSALGLIPLQHMVHEALDAIHKTPEDDLDFDGLLAFLSVYRKQEGFTFTEVADLRSAFESEAKVFPSTDLDEMSPGLMLEGGHVASVLIKAFGKQFRLTARAVQAGVAARCADHQRKGYGDGSGALSFREFLILARKARQLDMQRLSSEMLGFKRKSSGGAQPRGQAEAHSDHQDFQNADKDNSGTVSVEELVSYLKGQGFTALKRVVVEILEEVAAEAMQAQTDLDLMHFCNFMYIYRQREGFLKAEADSFEEQFKRFDEDGSGTMSTMELSDVFRERSIHIQPETLKLMIEQVDEEDTGEMDIKQFLQLMRIHRQSDLNSYLQVYQNVVCRGQGSWISLRKSKSTASINLESEMNQDTQRRLAEGLRNLGYAQFASKRLQELPQHFGLTFDNFVDLVQACCADLCEKERRKAGFSDAMIERYQEEFDMVDKDKSGAIDPKELILVLKAFKWEPKTIEQREELRMMLNKARQMAKEAGVEDVSIENGPEVKFWEFVQLARQLHTIHDKDKEIMMNKLMKELQFSQKEVNQFHTVFTTWAESEKDESEEDEGGDVNEKVGISQNLARRIVRSMGVSFTPTKKIAFDVQLQKYQEGGLIQFPGFLRLMRWMIDVDFVNQAEPNKK